MDETDVADLLTPAEDAVVTLLGQVWGLLVDDVVEHGRNARDDLAELAAHLHAIQNAVLAQAAARAYPDRYRRLGAAL